MKQKIIRTGNSAAVLIPKEILKEKNLKVGDIVEVEVKGKDKNKKTSISPEFLDWVDTYIENNRPALEELARK